MLMIQWWWCNDDKSLMISMMMMMAIAMAMAEEEDKDKDSSVSKALAWHNLKCSPECVSCFEDLPQSYVCDWCCVAEDLHAVFQRDGCWIGDCEPKKKEAIGEMFLHVHIKCGVLKWLILSCSFWQMNHIQLKLCHPSWAQMQRF